MTTKRMTCQAFTKAVNEDERTVEQIVSVFNNVDLGKDRVNQGAFVKTLEEWASSPNVMPAYFSHQWDDPFSNLGGVVDAAELAPGDTRLPADFSVTEDGKTLRDLGGLWVKYQVDPAGVNPKADQVFHLLKERRLTQASFAYDVVSNRKNSDGTNDLLELKLIEVGPTLLGMNPATTLLTAKSIESLAAESGMTTDQVKSVVNALGKDANHTFVPSEEDASKCLLCGKSQTAVAHISRLSSDGPEGAKAVSFTGSVEERQRTIYELANAWAMEADVANGGFYACHLEATFDDRAIFLVEGWDDPIHDGRFFEASVVNNDDGTIGLDTPTEVIVEQTVRPKALSSAAKAAARTTLRIQDQDRTKAASSQTDPDEGSQTGETGDEPEGGQGDEQGSEGKSKSFSADPTLARLAIEAFSA